MRVKIKDVIYDTELSKPLFDFVAKKERITIYESGDKFFCYGEAYENEISEIPKLKWLRFIPAAEVDSIRNDLPPINEGDVGMVLRPWQDYV